MFAELVGVMMAGFFRERLGIAGVVDPAVAEPGVAGLLPPVREPLSTRCFSKLWLTEHL